MDILEASIVHLELQCIFNVHYHSKVWGQ